MRNDSDWKMLTKLTRITRQVFASVNLKIEKEKSSGDRKSNANPCETLVLRLRSLQSYTPLRCSACLGSASDASADRTRSESVFACSILSKEL